MKFKQLTQAIIVFIALTFFTANVFAQVTIGSGDKPNEGALLDLKMTGTTTKGMVLPRVALTDPDNLFPMLTDNGGGGYTEGVKATEDALHAGLVVYNTNKCDPFGKGFYVWTGEQWQGINNATPLVLNPPSISSMQDTLHIPSGMDARTSVVQAISFNWAEADQAVWGNLTNTIGGGLTFAVSGREITPISQAWASSPATFSVWADDMTSSLVTSSSPWATLESKATISIKNECWPAAAKTLVLNQTNYAIKSQKNSTDIFHIGIEDATSNDFSILSNVPWRVSATSLSGTVGNILDTFSPASTVTTGVTLADNTFHSNLLSYTGNAGGAGTKYKMATLKFSDVHSRANDIEVELTQCQGTVASGNTLGLQSETAVNSDRSDWITAWGKSVIWHEGKAGVYEGFISADFGNAGRWMTINFSATQYDSDGTTITGPVRGAITDKCWAYPSLTPYTYTDDDIYVDNTFLGLLFNWHAATGKITSANEAGVDHGKVQGVCPNGWHIPNDYEWTELENEFINNTSKYAYMDDIDNTGASDIPHDNSTIGGRLITNPFINICEAVNSFNQQLSKSYTSGGFNLLFAGTVVIYDTPISRGNGAYFWSSSSYDENHAWFRGANKNGTSHFIRNHYTTNQRMGGKDNLYSVRCKKD
ncbi:FISUMP domain-containing protein [Dysgonomonas sp. 25]|uniref:FISUMP domain-containing protein n=1 Tax=Dysgonomonas sp. 25 TaxID=2302933 RepID=UPI0013D83F37|nr:FISUMP domain-containing protein [Dysgonomonas sp. 25]NDV67847.1 hypothetical protein [Dysgonomonas sp. 25]